MKRSVLFLSVFFSILSANAQTYNVREIVAADHDKLAGCEGPYRYDASPLTPAPKSYVPFYVSHYGRHGSRYAWNDLTYKIIWKILDAAGNADALTEKGKLLYQRYMDFYETPLINYGDLTELGYEQHRDIAARMCDEFPEVFSKGGKVLARSSTSPRAICSMSAFCSSMGGKAPETEIITRSLHTDMCAVHPANAPDKLAKRYEGRLRHLEDKDFERIRTIHYDDILNRLFSDRGFLEETGERTKFLSELFMFWAGYHNYCDEDLFEFIFTDEELVDFWEYENYKLYLSHSSNRYLMIPLLKDIIENAEAAISGSGYVGHMRFGHDTVLNAIIPLLNINGAGFQPERAEDIKYWFQNYNCPKAGNIQIILYKSKKNSEILFKLLLNNSEATLPQLEPVSGPYYRWKDFTSWAEKLYAEHPETNK